VHLPLAARLAGVFFIGLLIGVGYHYWQLSSPGSTAPPAGRREGEGSSDTNIPAIVPASKIVYVLPRDAIPSIDNPRFVKAAEADFLHNHDLVIGVKHNGIARAYPHKILVWHEIVNDVIADTLVAITYCPLCQTALAFIRVVEGRTVQFGVSGMLFNSDLVMYDRWSNTLWSQVWGKGLVGRFAGKELQRIPVDLMRWEDWLRLYPQGEVLSTETGFSRAYGSDPYRGYYTSPEIWFPVDNEDRRLAPKEPVWGVVAGGFSKAFPETLLREKVVLNDEVGGLKLVAFQPYYRGARFFERVVDGRLLTFRFHQGRLLDLETGSEWSFDGLAVAGPLKGSQLTRVPAVPAFWFAWAAFYPDTQLLTVSTGQAGGVPVLQEARSDQELED